MIKLHNITKLYRSQNIETKALADVSLHVKNGEFVSVMGPSGCGKTTLLNIIGFLDSYQNGLYIFDKQNINDLPEKAKLEIRKQYIGFVFQRFNLIDDLTVFENLELPLVYLKMPRKQRIDKVLAVLNRINMTHRKDHFPYQLSGGQQQKVAIGRAIVSQPKLILADEPTGNLDTRNGNEIMEMLSQLNDAGTTIIMVTHSTHDASYSKRIVRLLDGQITSQKKVLHAQF